MHERNIPERSTEGQQPFGGEVNQPEQRPPESAASDPLPSRDQLIGDLSAIERISIRWPNIEIRYFTPEEEARFRSWVAPLSDEELAQELRRRRDAWLRRNEAEVKRAAAEADEEPPDVIRR
jgi:hypothetical protein